MKNPLAPKPALILASLVPLLLFGSVSSGLGQGSLTPPGAPAPTMRSLDQIEPRTPISTLPFTITTGGHYYLTKSLSTTGDGQRHDRSLRQHYLLRRHFPARPQNSHEIRQQKKERSRGRGAEGVAAF